MIRYIENVIIWTFILYVELYFLHTRIIKNGWTDWVKPVSEYNLWNNKRVLMSCFMLALIPIVRTLMGIAYIYFAFVPKKRED